MRNSKSKLSWGEPVSTGQSGFTVFGSLPRQRNVMMVYKTSVDGEERYALRFNDGSLRQPTREHHATAQEAKDHAQACLALPISERGLRSRAMNATITALAICGNDAGYADALAAAQLAQEQYPEVDAEAIAMSICTKLAA